MSAHDGPPSSRADWPWLVVSTTVAVASGVLVQAQFRGAYGCQDEYCRLMMATDWSVTPFFAPNDHVWLGGNFWLLGTMIHLVPDPASMALFFGLASAAFCSAMAFRLVRILGGDARVAAAGSLLLSTQPIFAALARSPQPDLLWLGLLFLTLAETAQHFRQTDRLSVGRPAIFGTLSLIAGQTLRYENWYLTLPAGLALLVAFVASVRNPAHRRAALPWFMLGALLAFFPMLWVLSSWTSLGSPLKFLANMDPTGRSTWELDMSYTWRRALYYPLYGTWQAPLLALAGLAGMAVVARRGRGERAAVGLLVALWAIMEASTIAKGTGNAWPFRLALPVFGPLALMGVFAAEVAIRRRALPGAMAVAAMLALTLGWYCRHVEHPAFPGEKQPFAKFVMLEKQPNFSWVRQSKWLFKRRDKFDKGARLLIYTPGVPGWDLGFWAAHAHLGSHFALVDAADTARGEELLRDPTIALVLTTHSDLAPWGFELVRQQRNSGIWARPATAKRLAESGTASPAEH